MCTYPRALPVRPANRRDALETRTGVAPAKKRGKEGGWEVKAEHADRGPKDYSEQHVNLQLQKFCVPVA